MSGSIKTFLITYDPINQSNTFRSGDTVQGRVLLELKKQVKIDKLYIKCKGDASVHWTESNNASNFDDSYRSHERYFKLKQIFIWDSSVIGTEPVFRRSHCLCLQTFQIGASSCASSPHDSANLTTGLHHLYIQGHHTGANHYLSALYTTPLCLSLSSHTCC